MMKNVNLTGLYLALIAKCDVTGFDLSSTRKRDSKEPSDVLIRFTPRSYHELTFIDMDEVKSIVHEYVEGDFKTLSVKLGHGPTVETFVEVYIEFNNSDWNDDYAYPTKQ